MDEISSQNERLDESELIFPLSHASVGRTYIVVSYDGDDAFAERLAELGFVRGARVKPCQKVFGGMKVVINGATFGLSRSVLNHIIVTRD